MDIFFQISLTDKVRIAILVIRCPQVADFFCSILIKKYNENRNSEI
jgi:hypothetical protein